MTKHHLTHREPGWKRSVVINATAAVVCLLVVLIFAITEFTRGAWVVVVVMPILIYGLMKTNAQYRAEDAVLDEGVALAACVAPVLRRHTAIVLVDRIDLATARAIQYARNLTPDELYAVHFNIDNRRAEPSCAVAGPGPLQPAPRGHRGRRPSAGPGRARMATKAAGDGQTEVSVLIPTRSYRRSWAVLLHGKNADRLVRVLGHVPHVNATLVPFNVADLAESQRVLASPELTCPAKKAAPHGEGRPTPLRCRPRSDTNCGPAVPPAAKVAGRLCSVRIQPSAGVPRSRPRSPMPAGARS